MKKKLNNRWFIFALLGLLIQCKQETKTYTNVENSTKSTFNFEVKSSDATGINFKNTLTPNMATMANLFDFDFFYNGAGVGVADINNDGLQDIFFSGNQVENRLYLNKGDLKFEDITAKAGVNLGKKWSNGVTFVDINNDGYIDIYVSQGGPNKDIDRKNLLFINNQNLTFTEQAEQYGLADKGITTQSAFADFDGDGDMDCIVMNEAELFGYDLIPFYQKVNHNNETLWFNSSHIYENTGSKFVDRTFEVGFDQPSFGLGLIVTDLNGDDKPDIYIANDYYVPDAMYINKGGFKFTDEIKSKTNQVSFYGMGMDVADINNDEFEDIFVLDMAAKDHYRAKTLMASMNVSFFDLLTNQIGFVHQYMYNSLQLNDKTGGYNNIAQLAGISSTDWSWTAIMEDFDQDGYRDIYITNGYRKYALDNDFKAKVNAAKEKYNGKIPIDVKTELYTQIPEEKLSNIFYQNNHDLTFSDITSKSGLDISTYSNGGAAADFDNDGDIDIVVNNIDDHATLLENKATNNWIQIRMENHTQTDFPKITIKYNRTSQIHQMKRVRGYMSSSQPVAHFGIGDTEKIDSIIIRWNNGKNQVLSNVDANQIIRVKKEDAQQIISTPKVKNLFTKVSLGEHKLFYKHNEDEFDDFAKESLLPHKQSTDGPCLRVMDLNGDNKQDIFVGAAKGHNPQLFIQQKDGNFDKTIYKFTETIFEDTDATFVDIDKDGTKEIIITSGGNSDKELNFHSTRIAKLKKGQIQESVLTQDRTPGVSSKVIHYDFDKDGFEDIIIANRVKPQSYPIAQPSIYLKNQNGTLIDKTQEIAPDLSTIGIINDILPTDVNNDGWMDIIAVGDWTGIHVLLNKKGNFEPSNGDLQHTIGWWNSIQETDIDNDGDKDYVIGNLGLNSKYKSSIDKPLKIFADDFDKSGSLDIVLSKKYKDDYVPFRGRECSSQQMPFIKEKFPTYDLFAKASIEDVYGDLGNVYHKEANEFRSVLLHNDGKGDFSIKKLPKLAQAIPIKDMVSIDLNSDGFEDIIAIGNIYNTEVETPRMDYNSGIVLISDRKSNYKAISSKELGLNINRNAKSIETIDITGETHLIIGINNDLLNLYKINR